MKLYSKMTLTSIVLLLVSTFGMAQGGNPPPPMPPPPPGLPIDGFVWVVLFFGLLYGIKKTIALNKLEI